MLHRVVCAVIAALLAAGLAVAAPAGDSATEHARAWFAAVNADEAAMRALYRDHFSPEALAQVPVDARLERWRAMREREGLLTLVGMEARGDASVVLRARNASGALLTITFECEARPPHRLIGARVEIGGPGGDDGAAAALPGPPLADADGVRAIAGRLDSCATAGSFSGVALLARDGRVLLEQGWGEARRSDHVAVRPDTRFNFGSIGKILTKTAIVQLAQAGKLSLDDRLSKYLPGFPHADSITLEMLVEHRSGVGDIFNDRYDAMDRATLRHNRDYLALIRDQPLWFAPGTAERYSNGGYVLLGEVVAKASGEDYYDYLRDHVLKPAGMTVTGWPAAGEHGPDVATGYTRGEAKGAASVENTRTLPGRGSAAGGGFTTAQDLLALDVALTHAKLCDAGWSAWVTGGPRPRRGGTLAAGGPVGFSFNGGAPGISAEWNHEGPVVLIVLSNRDPEAVHPVTRPLAGVLRRLDRRD